VVAWAQVVEPLAAVGSSAALVFSEPETFDLVPLAVRWGWPVAVAHDGKEAEALNALLADLPRHGPYAIGTQATSLFLRRYDEAIPITSRAEAFRSLGLTPDELPPVIREAIAITRDALGAFL